MRYGVILLLLAALLSAPVVARATPADIAAGIFSPRLTWRLNSGTSGGLQGMDIKEAVGLRDAAAYTVTAAVSDRVQASYAEFNYSGARRLLPVVSLDLVSAVNLRYGGVGYFAPVAGGDRWRVDGLFEVKGYSVKSTAAVKSLRSPSLQVSGFTPVVGLRITGWVSDNVALYGQAAAVSASVLGSFWDAAAGIRYRAGDDAALNIGYRSINIDSIPAAVTARLAGPYFGLDYMF